MEIEINLYKEIFKALLFVLVADIGGTLTLILNFDKYNQSVATILISLGFFTILGLLYALVVVLFDIKNLKSKLEA